MLWDNTTRFVFTLAAAIIAVIAYLLFPSRAQVEQKLTDFYDRRGKWALFAVAFLSLGLAGVLGWEFFRYNVQTGWVGVNMGIYAILGAVLLGGNIVTMRAVKHDAEHVELVDAEVVEVQAETVEEPAGTPATEPAMPPSQPPQG